MITVLLEFFKKSSSDIYTIFRQLSQRMLNLLVDYSYLQISYPVRNNLKPHKDAMDPILYFLNRSKLSKKYWLLEFINSLFEVIFDFIQFSKCSMQTDFIAELLTS